MSETLQSAFLPAVTLDGTETLPVLAYPPNGVERKTTVGNISAFVAPVITATAGAEAADVIKVTFTSTKAAAQKFWVELVSAADASYALADGGAGSIDFDNTTTKRTLVVTNASGVAEVDVTDTATETISIAFGSGPGTGPLVGGTQTLSFAA